MCSASYSSTAIGFASFAFRFRRGAFSCQAGIFSFLFFLCLSVFRGRSPHVFKQQHRVDIETTFVPSLGVPLCPLEDDFPAERSNAEYADQLILFDEWLSDLCPALSS